MYLDKQAGTPTQAMQVVDISIWKYKIIKTNIDLIYAKEMCDIAMEQKFL